LRLTGVALVAGLCIAISLPSLIAYNLPPSPTALNQICAMGTWGLVLLVMGSHSSEQVLVALALAAAPAAALAAVALAVLLSGATGVLPASLALSSGGMVLITLLVLAAGAAAAPSPALWNALFVAWVLAGAASLAIGLIQVFAPDLAEGPWIARSGIAGRAVGNLRQPNHLSTLLLWSAAAVVPLLDGLDAARHRFARWLLATLFAALLFGVVLSGSRTGLVGVAVFALWGLADRSLSRAARGLLLASPLICLAAWAGLDWWSAAHHSGALGAATRLGEGGDISSTRFAIWRNTLALIARNPWLGVGFGEFNFAWTLTVFPDRPVAFFDHTHNLPLHLAVELGLPLALLVLGLLGWGLWQAFQRSRAVPGPGGVARRAAFVMVLLMAIHSQLEYPLWYAYFLLPTAFAWGLCLHEDAAPAAPAASAGTPWLRLAGVALMLAAAFTVWDYRRVVAIFAPPVESTETLAERIVEGQHSWLFAHHADYALVTMLEGAGTLPGAFDRATHFLLDTRLMIAWANGLAAQGDVERARYIAARLREFRNPNAKEFFAPCDDPAVVDKPFQCSPPGRAFGWRDFRPVEMERQLYQR